MARLKFKTCSLSLLLLSFAGCNLLGDGTGNTNDNVGGGDQRVFESTLTGDVEVPPVETVGTGTASYTLDDAGTLSFNVEASGLSGPVTAAHFHQAPVGVDGDVIFDLESFIVESNGEVTIVGEWELTNDQLAALLNGDIYVNLHTELNPGGEIRGQVVGAD